MRRDLSVCMWVLIISIQPNHILFIIDLLIWEVLVGLGYCVTMHYIIYIAYLYLQGWPASCCLWYFWMNDAIPKSTVFYCTYLMDFPPSHTLIFKSAIKIFHLALHSPKKGRTNQGQFLTSSFSVCPSPRIKALSLMEVQLLSRTVSQI